MLRIPTPDHIRELIRREPRRWCVSITMPTHVAGQGIRQDPIRLKNLLTDAHRMLCATDAYTEESADALLQPARELLDDREFWRHQEGGLALYLDETGMTHFVVPDELSERCVVADRFHLKPLLPRLEGDGTFHILALSRNDVRLLRATRDTVAELDRGDIPASLEDALGHQVERETQQGRVARREGKSTEVATHGHGKGEDDREDELRTFLQRVDAAVHARLGGGHDPVVLAGVDEVTSVYRKLSKLGDRLCSDTISRNPDRDDIRELHDRAWALVEEIFDDNLEPALERMRELQDSDRVLTEIAQVVKAAREGRVETLIAAVDTERWGRFDRQRHEVLPHEEQQPGDVDLVDAAAQLGLRRGAKLVMAVQDDLPGNSPLAALLHRN